MTARRWNVRLLGLLSALAVVAAGCGGGGQSAGEQDTPETIELTLGAGHPAGGAISTTNYSERFLVPEIEQRVEEETDYTVSIAEQYGGSVAPLGEVLEATQSGLLDIGLVIYPFEPSNLFLWNMAYYVPFGSPDPQVVTDVTRQTLEANPEMTERLESDFNQKLLGFGAVGNYGLITTFPWEEVDELEGKKISAAGPNLPWVEAIGAVPVQGTLNEWYTSFQTGVFTGGIMYIQSYGGFKLYEVAPHFKETDFGAISVGGVHMNLDTYNELPEEVRAIIEEVAREYEATIGEAVEEDETDALAAIEDGGATITELPEDQRVAWAEQLPDIPNRQAKEADTMGLPGSKVMSDYLQFMRDTGYEFPRAWAIE